MKEATGKDKYGNEYTDTCMSDGRIKRCTQTNRNKDFEFLGDKYSWKDLQGLSIIRTYLDEYHEEIKLVGDKYGRLLLYFYNEYMGDSDGKDREDYLWVVVKDESDAEGLAEVNRFRRLRPPYIAADENEWMAAHQLM